MEQSPSPGLPRAQPLSFLISFCTDSLLCILSHYHATVPYLAYIHTWTYMSLRTWCVRVRAYEITYIYIVFMYADPGFLRHE